MRISIGVYLVLIALALVCVAVTCDETADAGNKQLESARSRFKLPKLFDFARYKELFKKRYGSLVEELARQKIVLAKAFKSLISMIKYKFKKISHYLGINQLSDRTQAELNKLLIPYETLSIEASKNHTFIPKSHKQPELEVPETEVASLDDIQEVIAEVEQHKSEPGYREIAEEFERAQGQSRSKRDAGAKRRDLNVDDLIGSPDVEEESKKSKRRVPSNNPAYEPPMLDSFGSDDQDAPKSSMSGNVISFIGKYSGATYLKDMVSGAAQALMATDTEGEDEDVDMMDIDEEHGDVFQDAQVTLPDAVYFDHRDSECFFRPRSQGECGACYAFAAISLYEWDFCRQTGFLVPFSEQYIVDCGFATGTKGCEGGVLDGPVRFVGNFGLELRADYPYREKFDQCPYGPDTDSRTAGYIRYKKHEHKFVAAKHLDDVLPNTPILIGVFTPTDFSDYGGGVDDAESCTKNNGGHAMLMVGAGREDGKEYYIIRNSHSIAWGEEGYWKVSKEGIRRCLADGFGVITRGRFKTSSKSDELISNPLYQSDPVKTRYQAYLNLQSLGV